MRKTALSCGGPLWLAVLLCPMLAPSLRADEAEEAFRQSAVFKDPRCSAEEQRKIEEAIPQKARAAPAKPRKLLIFELNVGYPGPPTRFKGGYLPGAR